MVFDKTIFFKDFICHPIYVRTYFLHFPRQDMAVQVIQQLKEKNMNKENSRSNEPSAIQIKNFELSKIPLSVFRKAETQAHEFHAKHHKAYQPISYGIFSTYITKWEKYGEHSFLFQIALPLFDLFEDNFWKEGNREVFLNLFSGGTRSTGKWMRKFLALYKQSTSIQQLLLEEMFRDIFDVSLNFIVSNNFNH